MRTLFAALAALGLLALAGAAQADGCGGGKDQQQTSRPAPSTGS